MLEEAGTDTLNETVATGLEAASTNGAGRRENFQFVLSIANVINLQGGSASVLRMLDGEVGEPSTHWTIATSTRPSTYRRLHRHLLRKPSVVEHRSGT